MAADAQFNSRSGARAAHPLLGVYSCIDTCGLRSGPDGEIQAFEGTHLSLGCKPTGGTGRLHGFVQDPYFQVKGQWNTTRNRRYVAAQLDLSPWPG